jgi:SNF2 family DNA or RNA helicase
MLLTSPETISEYFLITNVESLRNEDIVAKISELCKNKSIGLIAADEVHKMKNPTSQQGKGFLKINSECKIAMTGTPLMNTPLDLYIILKWLGYEKHSFYAFKNHYCVMGGFGGYEIIGYKNMAELQEQLDTIMLRRLKEEVLDLPEKTYIDEYVDMTAKQSVVYKEIKSDIKANIDMLSIAPNPLAEMIRLRQATGYTGILSSQIQESAKLDRMMEIIADARENSQQVVVFSNWSQITDEVKNRIHSHYTYVTITGETKDSERQSNVEAFQDGRAEVFIGTIGAAGTGLTLTAGKVIILLDEPWSMALREQAVDRCHRIGQNTNITIYTLMCKNTIDEKIHRLVYEKGEMSDKIVDGAGRQHIHKRGEGQQPEELRPFDTEGQVHRDYRHLGLRQVLDSV